MNQCDDVKACGLQLVSNHVHVLLKVIGRTFSTFFRMLLEVLKFREGGKNTPKGWGTLNLGGMIFSPRMGGEQVIYTQYFYKNMRLKNVNFL